MKQDEIIEIARQAGFNPQSLFMKSKLEAFAKLVAAKHDPKIAIADAYRAGVDSGIAAEREACAKVCEWYSVSKRANVNYSEECAKAIRSRGKPTLRGEA